MMIYTINKWKKLDSGLCCLHTAAKPDQQQQKKVVKLEK